jgi:predicted TPR repeat methyltransferase
MATSSGNPTADRRFDMAQQLRARGDTAAAIDLLGQALELVPAWPEGRFILGEWLMESGAREQATQAFQAYLLLDQADSMGAGAKLALLGARTLTHELSGAYVARLFDQYAPTFEHALVQGLHYTAPKQIRDALDRAYRGQRFDAALDLGCGTGLMGAAMRDRVGHMTGVDLSERMLAEARTKNIYDALRQGSLLDVLQERPDAFDLIVAADVLVYIGDLGPVLKAAYGALRPNGVLVVTLQKGTNDIHLGPEQRFSHSELYVKRLLSQLELAEIDITERSFRREKKVDVPGLLVMVRRA